MTSGGGGRGSASQRNCDGFALWAVHVALFLLLADVLDGRFSNRQEPLGKNARRSSALMRAPSEPQAPPTSSTA
ncbi:hypothetical protein VTO73DRAFT_5603 [Trametes versicolor]